ncbi:MAG: hypothetical protein LBU32_08295, partial [Clostridiales bacterium]|nr:hypothetical protein [Clostridiales bacterium]
MTIINMNGNDEIAGEIGLPMDGFFSGHAEEAINMADELIQGWSRKKAALLLALYLGIICKRSLENYINLCKPDGYGIEQSGLHHIDSACGRVHVQMYKVAGPLKITVFDTAKDLFPEKANFNERCKTDPFRESAVGFAANTTYSQTMDYINRHVAEAEKFSGAHYFHSLLQNEGDSLAEAMDSL